MIEMTASDYYADLRVDYTVKIRQLVPKYDEMVACIVRLLALRTPRTVLDIGAGIGNLTALVLDAVAGARVTALEVSGAMFDTAAQNLQPYGDRVRLVRQDVLDFEPPGTFDAIFSNLVLHNVDLDRKRRLLRTLQEWLEPGGVFVWGDLIRHKDEVVERDFVEYRKEFALAAGCPPELVRVNFAKESRADHPLTVECTLEATEAAGFANADLVWAHDTFAVVVALKRE